MHWWQHRRFDETFHRDPCDDLKRRRAIRGDTLQFEVQVFLPVPSPGTAPAIVTPSYVPANITGWYMWATLKWQWPDVDTQAIAQVTSLPRSTPTGGSIVFTLPLQGIALVTFPAFATTLSFPDSEVEVVYDVQVQDTTSPVPITTTVERGVITYAPDVTRSITQP